MTNQKPSTFPKASDPKYWGWDIDTGSVFKEADYQTDINGWFERHRNVIMLNLPEPMGPESIDYGTEEYITDLESTIYSILEALKVG